MLYLSTLILNDKRVRENYPWDVNIDINCHDGVDVWHDMIEMHINLGYIVDVSRHEKCRMTHKIISFVQVNTGLQYIWCGKASRSEISMIQRQGYARLELNHHPKSIRTDPFLKDIIHWVVWTTTEKIWFVSNVWKKFHETNRDKIIESIK